MKILIFLSGMIAIALIACSSSAPTENEPTPDIDATVEARAKELVAAQATEIATPMPTKQPTMTPTPLPTTTPTLLPLFEIPFTGTGLWEISESIDAMTDKVSHSSFNFAVSGEGTYGDSISVGVSCADTLAMVTIHWGSFINLDSTSVTWRWDSTDALSGRWSLNSSGDMTYLLMGAAERFVKDMLKSKQLTARVIPYYNPSLTAIFDVRGLEEDIKPPYEGCPGFKTE